MPIIDNVNFTFLNNNQLGIGYNSLSVDSEQGSYPFTNSLDTNLYKQWRTDSFFKIDTTNNTVYINDGADKTATITSGNYTGATLATEIQSRLNVVSSGWTVTYSTTTYTFTISNIGSVTLRLSEQTNGAWFTIGFSSITNQTGTTFTGDEQRNHYPSVSVEIDFGYSANIGGVVLLSPKGADFTISEGATITVQGDNLGFLGTPDLTKTVTITKNGAILFINDVESNYRYWKITIEDIYNLSGPEMAIGYLYIGNAQQANERNVSTGLDYSLSDDSKISRAENGALYFDEKIKTNKFGSINIPLARQTTRDIIFDLFNENGTTRPFIFSIDPKGEISTTVDQLTKFVRFTSEPIFKNIQYDIFDISFTLEEVI